MDDFKTFFEKTFSVPAEPLAGSADIKTVKVNTSGRKKRRLGNDDHEENSHPNSAWKIVLADLMTALMVFFLILWLSGMMDDNKKRAIADHFSGKKDSLVEGHPVGVFDPNPYSTTLSVNDSNGSKNTALDMDQDSKQSEETIVKKKIEDIKKTLNNIDITDQVLVEYTDNGVVLTIIDNKDQPMFVSGSDEPELWVKKVVRSIVPHLRRGVLSGHKLTFEGFTDNKRFGKDSILDNMTLSLLRADAIRFEFSNNGINDDRIKSIRGQGKGNKEDESVRKVKVYISRD